MSVPKTKLIFVGLLIVAYARAGTNESAAVSELLANRIAIIERAADNREFAAVTQVAHVRELERQALAVQEAGVVEEGDTEGSVYKKVGAIERNAALLYGIAADNFDKAAANQQRVAELSSRLGKSVKTRNAQTRAANLKTQADLAIQLAGAACERAAAAYDKAHEPVEVTAASQQAAVWLETLASR
jgi:hypothetical protein